MFIISRVEKKQKIKKQKSTSLLKLIKILFLIIIFITLFIVVITNIKFHTSFTDSKNVTKTTNETNIHSNKNNRIQNKKGKTNNKKQLNSKRIIKNDVDLDKYLFLGDSYTVLLKDTIKENNPNAIIKAKTGVQPKYWIKNFERLPDNEDINGVILLIGVNGVAYEDNIRDTETLIDSLVEKYQDKSIYVERVFPVGEIFQKADPVSFNKSIKKHNKKINDYCNKYNNVAYIDTTNKLINKDGYLKYTNDGLHIKPNKQKRFYKNIVNAITDNQL